MSEQMTRSILILRRLTILFAGTVVDQFAGTPPLGQVGWHILASERQLGVRRSNVFCASLNLDDLMGFLWRRVCRHNDRLHPGRVINRVQVLFTEIRGDRDYSVAAPELRS